MLVDHREVYTLSLLIWTIYGQRLEVDFGRRIAVMKVFDSTLLDHEAAGTEIEFSVDSVSGEFGSVVVDMRSAVESDVGTPRWDNQTAVAV